MKVKLLKSGLYAHPLVYLPQVDFVEGKDYVVDDIMCASLLENGWVENPTEKKEEKEAVAKVVKKVTKKKKKGK